MNDEKKADEVLDFTFNYLDKVLKEDDLGTGREKEKSNSGSDGDPCQCKENLKKESKKKEECTKNPSCAEN